MHNLQEFQFFLSLILLIKQIFIIYKIYVKSNNFSLTKFTNKNKFTSIIIFKSAKSVQSARISIFSIADFADKADLFLLQLSKSAQSARVYFLRTK